MLKIVSNSESHKNNFFYKDFFPKNNFNHILLTHSLEKDIDLSEINRVIMNSIISLEFDDLIISNLEQKLKDFFVELNWHLVAKFNKLGIKQRGISLFMGLQHNGYFYFVQFGRFLAGKIENKQFETIGKKWDNFHVKTIDSLELIGNKEEDINVKINKIELSDDAFIFALPFKKAHQIQDNLNYYTIEEKLKKEYKKEKFPYFLANTPDQIEVKKKKWIFKHKLKITFVILLLFILGSIYYSFFGNNEIENQLNIQSEKIKESLLNIDIENLHETFKLGEGILFIPARNVEMKIQKKIQLPFPVSRAPHFDYKRFYFTSDSKLAVYSKTTFKEIWSKQLPSNISTLNILDSNLLLCSTTADSIYCFKKNTGSLVWKKRYAIKDSQYKIDFLEPIQISLQMDKRLLNSLSLLPVNNKLILINNINGKHLSSIELENEIKFITPFDIVEKRVYVVENDKLILVSYDIYNKI